MQRKSFPKKFFPKKKKKKDTQIKLKQILLLSLLVLLILFADAYRRGDVKIHQAGPVTSAEPPSQKKTKQKAEPIATVGKTNANQNQAADQKKIRILLTNSAFSSAYHEQIIITGTKGMTVSQGKQKKKYSAGEKLSISASETSKGKTVICPESDGRLQLLSVRRQNRHPKYRGVLEVKQTKQGLTLINELTLGEYLYAVVPSELSTGHPMEALKAQAVCARTYASIHLRSERYEEYGADMDDTTACQVYNNIPEDKRSRQAVKETAGQTVTQNDKLVSTYYYSTSWGKSASGKEVWNTDTDIPYLKSCMQTANQGNGAEYNLSTESAFRNFLQKKNTVTYDSDADWYRWKLRISSNALTAQIDSLLASCYYSDATKVLTQTSSGKYQSKPLKPMGKIRKIRIEKREKSGLVTELVIVGTENVVKVCSQYNIRRVLSPGSANIYYGGGKTTMSILPSAAFYFEDDITEDGHLDFVIYGGGCGHGTGMSQCGAVEMAKQGKKYQDILKYYFSGCEVAVKSISK